MSHRTAELAEREVTLRLHCALQRGELGRQVDGIQSRLQSIDRVVTSVRRILLRPAVIAGAALVLLVLGRVHTFRLLRRGLMIVATVRQLGRFAGL